MHAVQAAIFVVCPRQGSLLHKDRVAAHSDELVETLEANGAIVLGKTNTPEFGAGGNTFNECAPCVCSHGALDAGRQGQSFLFCVPADLAHDLGCSGKSRMLDPGNH